MKRNTFGARLKRKKRAPRGGWGTIPTGKANRHRISEAAQSSAKNQLGG